MRLEDFLVKASIVPRRGYWHGLINQAGGHATGAACLSHDVPKVAAAPNIPSDGRQHGVPIPQRVPKGLSGGWCRLCCRFSSCGGRRVPWVVGWDERDDVGGDDELHWQVAMEGWSAMVAARGSAMLPRTGASVAAHDQQP